ncbi:MAG TPA: polysaccharide deacetylase family protein [Terriglobales bacterium]|nr:polysaccharide deacetylase family protein [Terriglobales bacterium]
MTTHTLVRSLARRVPPPALRALDRLRGAPWPYSIVAFHRIGGGAVHELDYPAAGLEALGRYWRDHYEILTLDCLLARLAHRDAATHPCLTITFDDGYADNAEVAAPILDRLNLSATFFVTTAVIGTRARFAWDAGLAQAPRLMTWAQVRELRAAGFGVGSHTATHARLAGLRGAELHYELVASRQRLQQELGEPVEDFAYPFGGAHDCDAAAREAVRRAGYRCCLSCHGGGVAAADSPFHLRRISISPRHHATPQAWARTYTRLRWAAARADGRAHW